MPGQYTVMARATQRRRPPKTQTRRPRRVKANAWPDDYLHITRRPLQSLVFLLPMIFAYEIGMALTYSSTSGQRLATSSAQ